ncbi:hypothetical protein Drorol1_Dr00000005, partial [Drosera rotundifolia]
WFAEKASSCLCLHRVFPVKSLFSRCVIFQSAINIVSSVAAASWVLREARTLPAIAFTGDIIPSDLESFKLPLSSSGVSSEEFVQPLCHLSVGDQHSVFSRNCILGSQGSADSLPAITFIDDIIPSDL